MDIDSRCKALVPYKRPRTVELSRMNGKINESFRRRKRIYLSFFVVFSFFSALGSVFVSARYDIVSRLLGSVNSVLSSQGLSYAETVSYIVLLLMMLACVSASGLTVFGRVIPVLFLSYASFCSGSIAFAARSYLSDGKDNARDIALYALGAMIMIAVSLLSSEAFLYSERAFSGREAVFHPKSLLNYISVSLFSVFMITIFVFAIINL